MKRNIDDKGITNYIIIGIVAMIILVSFIAIMTAGGSGSTDNWNPITKRMYMDVDIDVAADLDSAGTFVIDEVNTDTETKRLNMAGLRWTSDPLLYITIKDQNDTEIDSIKRDVTFNFDNSYDTDSTGPHTLGPIEEGTNEVTLAIEFFVPETDETADYYEEEIDLRGAW